MKLGLAVLFLCFSWSILAQDSFQLAPPQFKYESVFFENQTTVTLEFAMNGALIYYSLNGNDPTEKDFLYSSPINVTDRLTIIKARVFAEGYISSEVSQATFIRQGLSFKRMTLSQPHSNYAGSGSNMLFDQRGGLKDHQSKTWLGYDRDTIKFRVELSKTQPVKSVVLHVLENTGAWIFAPTEVEVFIIDKETQKLRSVVKKQIRPTEKDVVACRVLEIPFKEIVTNTLVISVRSTEIPHWHPGKGKQGWFFIDEILAY